MRHATGKRKVKLAWIMNENARKASLRKRKLGLMKKVQELTILCDVKACLIIFSADEAEPLVWPNQEVARGLLDRYFALPDIERSKKAMNQESYLRDKAGKAQEQLMKSQKKNQEAEMDHLMFEINNGSRGLTDLTTSEIYGLISYSREKIGLLRKRGELIHQPPLRNIPGLSNQPASVAGDAAATGGSAGGEGSGVGANPMDNQNQYLMDQWIFHPSGSSNGTLPLTMAPPIVQQPVGMPMIPYQDDPNYIHMGIPIQYESFLPGQGNDGSSSANPNVEMNLLSPHNPQGSFSGMSGLALQPPNHRMPSLNLDGNPRDATSLVPMGLSHPSLGGPEDPRAMIRSQWGPFHSNLMGNDLGLMGGVVRECSSSNTPFELGLQQFGTDLRLHHHGFGGESSSAGGCLRLQPPGEGSSLDPRESNIGGPSGANKD